MLGLNEQRMSKYYESLGTLTRQAFLTDNKKRIRVYFHPGDNIFLKEIRLQPSRSYDPKNKTWYLPINQLSLEFLSKFNVEVSPKVTRKVNERLKVTPLSPELSLTPREYQKYSMGFIQAAEGRCLIGHEAGLGKTLISIGYIFDKKTFPALILCPASLKINWEREVYNLTGKTAQVIYGSPSLKQRLNADIVIINYDIIDRWEREIEKYNFKIMILDESQKLKNSTAKRTKCVGRISQKIKQIVALSATALENSPMDLYTTFRMIDPALFPNRHLYGVHFTKAAQSRYGKVGENWEYKGARNTKELYTLLNHIMIRYQKKDVLTELPPLQKVVVPFKINNMGEYRKAENEFINTFNSSGKKVTAMGKTENMKQIINKGKRKEIIEWISTYLESGDKLIVFGIHIEVVEMIQVEFKDIAVKLYGQQSKKKNQEAIDKFQTDSKTKLLVANIQSGGVGLTLTAAPAVAFVELPWNPALLYQAENRIHRIGQEADKLTAYYLIATDTIEEKILHILDEKTKIRNQILDGKEMEDHDVLTLLLRRIKHGKH